MCRKAYRLYLPLFLLHLTLAANAADDYLSPAVSSADLLALLGTPQAPQVIDLRAPAEFGAGHVPGAVNIPLQDLEDRLGEVGNDNGVLIYCINGSRTRQAEPVLYGNAIDNVYHLDGTFQAWLQGKYPVEKGGVKKSW